MRILLLGHQGQVGWELHRTLLPLGEVIPRDYPEIDLAKTEETRAVVRDTRPDVIVNATAYTDVDQAEREPEKAHAVNADAPAILAEEAKRIGAGFIHYSTDYVFDGRKGTAYVEEDEPNPINVYGESKLRGERAVEAVDGAYLILRTSWVYSLRRNCFVTKVLKWAREQETLQVVSDQIGSPTWGRMLAEITAQLLAMGKGEITAWLEARKGLYHLAGSGSASRYEWAKAVLDSDPQREEQVYKELLPARTADFPTPAKRPPNTALDCRLFAETFEMEVPTWESGLYLAMEKK